MGAMFGNLDHTAELEAPSVRAGRFTRGDGESAALETPRTSEWGRMRANRSTGFA